MDEKDQKIEEQGRTIEDLTRKLNELNESVQELLRSFKNHKHEGPQADGSLLLQRSIDLLQGQSVGAGGVAGFTGVNEVIKVNDTTVSDRTLAAIVSGRDSTAADGLTNSQLLLEHQYNTESTTKQTFFYGIRAPLYTSTSGAVITSGGTVLKQNLYKLTVNSLAGAYIVVNSTTGTFAGFQIESNTVDTITITGGTWTFSGTDLGFTVFMPIYMGSATYPWRRLYTGDLSSGGIRFGYGTTAGGQNGLLYMSSNGMLRWRKPNGSDYEIDLTGD